MFDFENAPISRRDREQREANAFVTRVLVIVWVVGSVAIVGASATLPVLMWILLALWTGADGAAAVWWYRKARAYRMLESRREQAAALDAARPVTDRLPGLRARHDAVVDAYGAILTDPVLALDHVALSDVREARTADFVRAYAAAHDDTVAHPAPTGDELERYASLVREVEMRWADARDYAARVGIAHLRTDDAKTAGRARALLITAADPAASEAERSLAAKRAEEQLDLLVDVALAPQARAQIASLARGRLEP